MPTVESNLVRNSIWISIASILFVLFSCSNPADESKNVIPKQGLWQMEMTLKEGVVLPFRFSLEQIDSKWTFKIVNADEEIVVENVSYRNDSLIIKFPVFESEIKLLIQDSVTLSGQWINYYKGDDYQLDLKAKYGEYSRFKTANTSGTISKQYEVSFSPNTDDEYKAIGLFKQEGSKVKGTFATETGDYRHLEGVISRDSLYLSTFDGSHAFLFKAAVSDSTLEGIFWSGNHYQEPWVARVNPEFTLRNADSLTFLKEGYTQLSFSFPNESGKLISLQDEKYKNKVVIVQVMGSWCPNCLDETNYFSTLYDKYNKDGLEIIALAFERTKSKEKAMKNLNSLKAKTKAEYEFLMAGSTKEDKAQDILPMLNHIMSYPTAIYIGKNGDIKRIHTGFYGPSTGHFYTEYVEETEAFIESLLAE